MNTCNRETTIRKWAYWWALGVLTLAALYLGWQLSEANKRTEEAQLLAQWENERTEQFILTAPVAMVLADSEGNITVANPGASEMFGYERAEFLDLSVHDLLPPGEERDRHRQAFDAAMAKLEDKRGNWYITANEWGDGWTKDGERISLFVATRGIRYRNRIEFIAVMTGRFWRDPELKPWPEDRKPPFPEPLPLPVKR